MKPLEQLDDDELTAAAGRAERLLPDAPAAWIRRAEALLPGAAARAGAALRRLVATLRFDSLQQPALGMRGDAGAGRQLLFSVEQRDIDLRVLSGRGGVALIGQVLGPDEQGEIHLQAADGGVHTTVLDALGAFRFDAIAPGPAVLTLRLGADEIVLPAIDLA